MNYIKAILNAWLPGQPVVLPLVLPLKAVQDAADLLGSLVEVEAGGDELVSLLRPGDEVLPAGRHAVSDVLHSSRVEMILLQERLGPLSDVDCRAVSFLQFYGL